MYVFFTFHGSDVAWEVLRGFHGEVQCSVDRFVLFEQQWLQDPFHELYLHPHHVRHANRAGAARAARKTWLGGQESWASIGRGHNQ